MGLAQHIRRWQAKCVFRRFSTCGIRQHTADGGSKDVAGAAAAAVAKEVPRQRVFSGIQPTGVPHLGNYLGAVKNWVKLQYDFESTMYSVVDLHALTANVDSASLKQNTLTTAASLLACGLDPERCILYRQSDVHQHASLAWIFCCQVTEARLKKLTQWQEKAKQSEQFSFGLITYPVLMAADILLYKSTHVPVGADQIQHLSLAREIAHVFNNRHGFFFPKPDAIFTDTMKIKSLRDPASKMSKSDKMAKSSIKLNDSPEEIVSIIKKAVTDHVSEVYYDPEARPGVSNLIEIHSGLTGMSRDDVCEWAKGMDTGKYKLALADVIAEELAPIREEMARLDEDRGYLQHVLENGAKRAAQEAEVTLKNVNTLLGLR